MMSAEGIARLERILAWSLGSILALNIMLVIAYVCGFACQRVAEWWLRLWSTR